MKSHDAGHDKLNYHIMICEPQGDLLQFQPITGIVVYDLGAMETQWMKAQGVFLMAHFVQGYSGQQECAHDKYICVGTVHEKYVASFFCTTFNTLRLRQNGCHFLEWKKYEFQLKFHRKSCM